MFEFINEWEMMWKSKYWNKKFKHKNGNNFLCGIIELAAWTARIHKEIKCLKFPVYIYHCHLNVIVHWKPHKMSMVKFLKFYDRTIFSKLSCVYTRACQLSCVYTRACLSFHATFLMDSAYTKSWSSSVHSAKII